MHIIFFNRTVRGGVGLSMTALRIMMMSWSSRRARSWSC